MLQVIGLVADITITYAAQRTSPTTATICVYAGVSVMRSAARFAWTDEQVVFSSILQWLLYGNHPSPVAFAGMAIVLVAGLYGVVSMRPSGRLILTTLDL